MKSDTDLRREVEEELEWEPSIDARNIGVSAIDGVVTLTGEVDTYYEKWKSERAAERVAGVKAVVNDLVVRAPGEHTDVDIALAATDALKWNVLVPSDSVKLKVEKGWVTLTGTVAHDFQRRAAERTVRNLPGVRGLTNLIAVKPKAEPANIKAEIEKSFRRQATLDVQNIEVEVHDGEVVLRGTVPSWAERHEAEKVAWSAPGVTSVKNHITVSAAA